MAKITRKFAANNRKQVSIVIVTTAKTRCLVKKFPTDLFASRSE